jgi:Fe-S cluster assembly iron-binding protein IscA
MPTLTEDATEAIKELVGDRQGAGLQIFPGQTENEELQLGLSISDAPEPTDEVIEQWGCQVFLDQQVAPLLNGRTLDAAAEGRQVHFAFVA